MRARFPRLKHGVLTQLAKRNRTEKDRVKPKTQLFSLNGSNNGFNVSAQAEKTNVVMSSTFPRHSTLKS
jgi:hypothetical protein